MRKNSKTQILEQRWSKHTSRVNSLSWTSDGANLASGSLDTNVFVWSLAKRSSTVSILNAGPGGVNAVAWLENDAKVGKLASAGADGCVRLWDVTFVA